MARQNVSLIKFDPWSILKIFLIFLGFWILYLLRDVIFIVAIAFFFAAIFTPLVDFLEKKKFPRWTGAALIFLGIFLIIGGLLLIVGPTLIDQAGSFVSNTPEFLQSFFNSSSALTNKNQVLEMADQWFKNSILNGKSLLSLLGTVTGRAISAFMILVISFYLLVEKRALRSSFNAILPRKYRRFSDNFLSSAQKEIGAWARGMMLLCLLVGLLTYLGLVILRVKFAVVLAIIAGFTELIPWVGPWLGAIPAVAIALTQSPTLALLVIILYLIVQQVENNFFVPHIMHKAVGLNPLAVVIVLLIGGKLAGPIGMILAVPAATVVMILVREYLKYRKRIV